VYVLAFPAGDRKRQITTDGGSQSRWRADVKELYYMASNGDIMAVEVTAGETMSSGTPWVLFGTGLPLMPGNDQYTVTGDGQRFLVRLPVSDSAPITVVTNWAAALATAR
jgi:hypothetical protein